MVALRVLVLERQQVSFADVATASRPSRPSAVEYRVRQDTAGALAFYNDFQGGLARFTISQLEPPHDQAEPGHYPESDPNPDIPYPLNPIDPACWFGHDDP